MPSDLQQRRATPAQPIPDGIARRRSAARRFFDAWPPMVLLAIAWLLLMLFIALAADFIRPYDFKALDLRGRLQPPVFMGGTWRHILGSDELGRDVLSRLIESIRISLMIATASTLFAAVVGVLLGFSAAHFRGIVEHLVEVLVDLQASMPFLIIALAVLAFFGNSLTLFVLLMGLNGWERIARISRGLAISANEQGYASAVRDLGAGPWRIYGRHILPNIAATLIVSMTLNFPEVILLESGLSFLGLGVQPPLTSLGNMVGYGREYMQTAPWILLAPATTIVMTTLSVSIIGDWLRDRLDPTLR
jgi:peptide/nickel transport system permease protein